MFTITSNLQLRLKFLLSMLVIMSTFSYNWPSSNTHSHGRDDNCFD